MRRFLRLMLSVGCAALFSLLVFAGPSKPLTNDDVKKMVSSGFGDDIILAAIAANETNFDVSVDGLTDLRAAGVNDKILSAILQAAARKQETSTSSASPTTTADQPGMPANPPAAPPSYVPPTGGIPAGGANMLQQMMSGYGMGNMGVGMPSATFDPSQMPKVTLLDAENRQAMQPSVSQVAHTESKGGEGPGAGSNAFHMLSGLGGQALSFASFAGPYGMVAGSAFGMATGMIGGLGAHHGPPKVTKVWALAGHNSSVALPTHSPRFEISYGNLLGIDPDSYEPFLVKLVQSKDNWRLVGATKTKMSMGMGMGMMDEEALAKLTEVRLPVRATRMGRGMVQIEPSQPLARGEYGLVLRPLHPGKRSKGSLGGPAEQNVFYSVWDFSVN